MHYIIGILVLIISLGGGYAWTSRTHYKLGYEDRDGKCTAEKLADKNEHLEAQRQATAQRDKARFQADQAALELSNLQKTMLLNSERFDRENKRLASASRQCFSGSVASLLNSSTPITMSVASGDGAATAPARAAEVASGSPANAEGPGTSEQAASSYIDDIKRRFASCKAHLRTVLIATKNEPIE